MNNKKKKIEAIDLFCGIGGLTYGLRDASIDVLAGLDFDKTCADAYVKNNKSKFINADVSKYDFSEMEDLFSKDSVRVLVGCAPCQPFSSHTFKSKKKTGEVDLRWNLIDYFVKAVDVLRPDVISMENVRGLTKQDVFKNFVLNLESRGYKVRYEVVYCPKYGIPQNRSRMVLLGSKLGDISIPKPTHTKGEYVTVDEAIGSLPRLASGMADKVDVLHKAKGLEKLNIKRIKQSKPGGTWRDWDKSLLPKCYLKDSGASYASVYGRMKWDDVSPTITTQFFNYGSGRFGHPSQDRALSLREGALLQTFPAHYDFGSATSMSRIGRHIGNAVPPKLGEHIGKSIVEHVNQYHGR